MHSPTARLRAGVVDMGAAVTGFVDEHGNGLVRSDLVDHVGCQVAHEQKAVVTIWHPHGSLGYTEMIAEQLRLRVRRDNGVKSGIGPGQRKGLGRRRGPVTTR